jgi:hypothetical protein
MAQLPSQSQFGDYGEWPGRDVLDSGGERLGGVREIYLDRETGRPEWVLVDVDGDEARFVPLADASVESSSIRVAHSAQAIRSAPGIGSEPRIDQSEERRLYDHYGLGYSDSGSGLPAQEQPEAAEEEDPWQTYQGPAVTPREESSRSAAAEEEASNLAPPPAEPPSAEEIEQADIPEPPAASEQFLATTTPEPAPALEAPSDTPELAPPAEPAELPPAVPSSGGPIGDPVVASEPTPSTAGEILSAAPEAADLKAQPGPDAVRPAEPPRIHQAPPPPPEPAGGPLDVIAARKKHIAIGVGVSAVLLLVIRRLR